MNKNLIYAARREICAAGIRLVKEGLVARTWGNISVRIDENTMAITPSGVKYEAICPEHIAVININDGSFGGDLKPSGERKLHMEIYRRQPQSGSIIHTHQLNASVCSAARKDVPVVSASDREVLSAEIIRCGSYGLPGTKKLSSETVKAVGNSKCALMANHGAVCIGRDIEEAFTVSKTLEKVCEEFIKKSFIDITGLEYADDNAICGHYESQRGKR